MKTNVECVCVTRYGNVFVNRARDFSCGSFERCSKLFAVMETQSTNRTSCSVLHFETVAKVIVLLSSSLFPFPSLFFPSAAYALVLSASATSVLFLLFALSLLVLNSIPILEELSSSSSWSAVVFGIVLSTSSRNGANGHRKSNPPKSFRCICDNAFANNKSEKSKEFEWMDQKKVFSLAFLLPQSFRYRA